MRRIELLFLAARINTFEEGVDKTKSLGYTRSTIQEPLGKDMNRTATSKFERMIAKPYHNDTGSGLSLSGETTI